MESQPELPLFAASTDRRGSGSEGQVLPLVIPPALPRRSRLAANFFRLGELLRRQSVPDQRKAA